MPGTGRSPGAAAEDDDRLRRRVLWSMPSGLYVLGSVAGSVAGSGAGARYNLMTCNWATQVCMDPKLLAVGVEAASRTCSLLDEGHVFSLNVLRRRDRALVRRFVKPVEDVDQDASGSVRALAGQEVHIGTTGAPILRAARGWLECRVHERLALGSHVLYVGAVVASGGAGASPAGAQDPAGAGGDDADAVLRMEDTRMHYGG